MMLTDCLALLLSLLLPLCLGGAAVRFSRSKTAMSLPTWAETIAWGYPLGLLAITLLLRASSFAGVAFSGWGVSAVVVLCTALLLAATPSARQRAFWQTGAITTWQQLSLSSRWIVGLLLVWLALRYTNLLLEMAQRPLYAWDAFTQWATKAKIWFSAGGITPMAHLNEWAVGNANTTFIDAAPHYPATAPLMQVWTCLLLGRFDDRLMNLPWAALHATFSLGFWALARRLSFSPVDALIGATAIATLPLLGTHVALAGYAELPLTAFYGAAIFVLLTWRNLRVGARVTPGITFRYGLRYALLGLIFAAALPSLKQPGWLWLGSIGAFALVAYWPRAGLLALATASIGVLAVLLSAQSLDLAIGGYRIMSADRSKVALALVDNLFVLGNWHLFWAITFAVVLFNIKRITLPLVAPLAGLALFSITSLGIIFFFTVAADWVINATTVNRALMHVLPVWAALVLVLLPKQNQSQRAQT